LLKNNPIYENKKILLHIQIVLALILGAIFGTIFIKYLSFLAIPLAITSLMIGASSAVAITGQQENRKINIKTHTVKTDM